jgi:hypothetical protein
MAALGIVLRKARFSPVCPGRVNPRDRGSFVKSLKQRTFPIR